MPKSVLIVDDHAGFRSVANLLLTNAGYDVVGEAADGAEALAQTMRLQPEAVLLDIELPDMTGFAVAERLAALPNPPVVVLVSGRRQSDFGGSLQRAAALGFLAKEELSEDSLTALLH
jgi:DNA-binding NarL/FixJ family response regulator